MSIEYDNYIYMHRLCISKACEWILNYLPKDAVQSMFSDIVVKNLRYNIVFHDQSKYSINEYNAYDGYFYGEQTPQVIEEFDYAWLHHIHSNPHHWQYWILKEDDSNGYKCLEIPGIYIIEMISDWWSFSWKNYLSSQNKEDLYSIFDWYKSHENIIIMNPKSREKVETILNLIRTTLDEDFTFE